MNRLVSGPLKTTQKSCWCIFMLFCGCFCLLNMALGAGTVLMIDSVLELVKVLVRLVGKL